MERVPQKNLSLQLGGEIMFKKKVLAAILVVAMTCSMLTGCGSSSGNSSEKPSETPSESSNGNSNESSDQESSKPSSETVIKFGIHVANPAEQEAVTNSIVQAFNEEYAGQYKVEFVASDTESHSKNMKLAAQDGTLPEIFWIDASEAPEYAENDLLLDLSDYLKSSANVDKALNGMEDAFNNGTIQYGVPYQCNVQGIFYNKAIFDQAGLDYPTDETTYTEFVKMITDLKAAGYIPLSIGSMNSSFAMWEFNEFLSRYGWEDSYEAIAAGNGSYKNDAMVACFEKMEGLAKAGAFPENMTTLEYFDAKQLFNSGKAAMFGTGQWDCAEFDKNIGENVGFFWGPVFEDSKASQEVAMKVPSAPLVCSAAAKNDDATLKALYAFLDFYYGEKAAEIAYAGSIFPATSYSNVAATDTQYAMNSMIKALSSGWKSPAAAPDQTLSAAIQEQLYDSIFGVIQGTYSPAEALEKMDEVAAN